MEKSKIRTSGEALQIDEVGRGPVKELLLMLKEMRLGRRNEGEIIKEALKRLLDKSKFWMERGKVWMSGLPEREL